MFKIRQSLIDSLSTFLQVKCLRSHPLKAEEEYIIGKVRKQCPFCTFVSDWAVGQHGAPERICWSWGCLKEVAGLGGNW